VNGNHALLVVGASRTGSEEMGGIEFLVQTSSESKPFVIIGYDLLLSMGVNQLLAVGPGLSFSVEDSNLAHVAPTIQSGSPRYSEDDVEVPQEFQWGLNKPVDTTVSEEDCATGTMPSYWMLIKPNKIAKRF
jgi:hypothetical protein